MEQNKSKQKVEREQQKVENHSALSKRRTSR
jgi:hypothetical protein